MSAFGELGLDEDLCRALDDLGWSLPTPIQNEVIPLVLGGGDVMAAAETGSGKTGAFALPLLQVCHEVKRGVMKGEAALSAPPPPPTRIQLDLSDRDASVAVAPDGASAQSRHESAWAGVRASHGFSRLLANSGPEAMQVADAAGPEPVSRVYYEVSVQDEGLVRVGWAAISAARELGTDALSFGFGGTGKKSHAGAFADYGRAYGRGDVVGVCLDWDRSEISFCVNGESLGVAFQGEEVARLTGADRSFFPAVALKNAEVCVNFGARPWRFPPPRGFCGLDGVECTCAADAAEADAPEPRRPLSKKARSASDAIPPPASLLAVVLEPARELAEQTEGALRSFAAHLAAPPLSTVSVIGGLPAAQQRRALAAGPDVVVATPGRLLELLESGACSLQSVRFFVLDEADRLLEPGSRETVLKIFQAVPRDGTGVETLQVLLFSATLQSQRVRDEGLRLCRHPLLVDLKGRDVVPETVDHLMLRVDPLTDVSWLQSQPPALTDGVHAPDGLTLSPEALAGARGAGSEACSALLSEATKILKQRLVVRLMDALKMDRVLVFCRSNHDCSQLERFLNALNARAGASVGRGAEEEESGRGAPYSCAVCGGERSRDERRAALRAFGAGQVRVLIATDLAARGLHLEGLPFVINATLPDSAEQYVHRVGRVGRADARGLAVSLASTRREKVWFAAKGRKPWLAPDAANTRDVAQGGDTIWYDEPGLVAGIQEHLGAPVAELPPSLELPPQVLARAQGGAYGHSQAQAADRQAQLRRLAALQPTIAALAALEEEAQDRYFEMQRRDWTRLVR